MTYQPTDDDRRKARERVAARQVRHNQNSKQSTAGKFADGLSSLRSGAKALTSRMSNKTNRRNGNENSSIEDDFATMSYEEMYGLDDGFANNIVEREITQVDPYAEIPRNYNQRPLYNGTEYSARRPVQIQGQNEIMRPSQGQTSVRIPLIGSESVGSKQLSFSGSQNKIKTILLIVFVLLILFTIGTGIANCAAG